MKISAPAIILGILALAAAGFAWERNNALETARLELAQANERLQKAEARIKPLEASVEALRKDAAAQRQSIEQLRGELTSTKAFFEAERDFGLRLRDELTRTRELLAAAGKGRGAPPGPPPSTTALPPFALPGLMRPPPARVMPANPGAAIGAPAPAR